MRALWVIYCALGRKDLKNAITLILVVFFLLLALLMCSCGTVKKSLQNDVLVHKVSTTQKVDSSTIKVKNETIQIVEFKASTDSSKIVEVEEVTKTYENGIISKEVAKRTKTSNINKVDNSKKEETKNNKEEIIKDFTDYTHYSDSTVKDNSKKIDEIKESTIPKQIGLLLFAVVAVIIVFLYIYKKLT